MTIEAADTQRRLKDGVAAAQAGNRVRGRDLLLQVVQADRDNETAWWWLARCADGPHEQLRALEQVVRLNPTHAEAQAALLRLRQQQVADAPAARSAAQPIDWAALLPNSPLEADDGVDDPYQCPYCGRPTEPDDRRCPHCRGGLYARTARTGGAGALQLVLLLLGVSLSLTSVAVSSSRGLVSALTGGLTLLIELLEFSLLAAGMALLFRFMPNTHVRWRHAWAGAVFVALGFEVAKRALGWYVKSVPGYAMVYGAFATLPIFLLWIYLSWLIVLFGAVIAAYAPSLALHVVRRPDRPGERFALAVAVLRALQAARQADERGLSAEALAGRLRTDPLQVAPVLDDLLALGWCGRLDEEGAQRHVLLIEPERTPAQPLVDRLLLQDQASTAAFRQRSGWAGMAVADLLA